MHRLLLMYAMDPRGSKVGGIETHIRQILARHPADFSVLLVGTDEIGDAPLGQVQRLEAEGRGFDFIPVVRVTPDAANRAAKRLHQSTTLRYVLGALRHLGAIRRALGSGSASGDLHRNEFAPVARLLRVPAVQMIHGEGTREDQMDSLLKRYWFVHELGERLALRWASGVFCVNPNILRRLEAEAPGAAAKAELLSVSVDTAVFRPTPFDLADGVLRVCFAGRLDAFKDPPLMFRTLARLGERLGGRLEFHYVGAGDPERFAEFEAIRAATVRHGVQDAAGVAAVWRRCHAGIITSHFEGMPCFLLEGLAAGRPFGAIRLTQFDPLIEAPETGFLVERRADEDASAEAMAEGFLALWSAIQAGRIDPHRVAARIAPYALDAQMGRLFARHRAIQARGGGRAAGLAPA